MSNPDVRELWNEIYRSAARLGLCLVGSMVTALAGLSAWHSTHPTGVLPDGTSTGQIDESGRFWAVVALVLALVPLALIPLWSYRKVTARVAVPVVLGCVAVGLLIAWSVAAHNSGVTF